jgi:hypothetical protein
MDTASGSIEIHILSLGRRRTLARAGAFENDGRTVWPGLSRLLSNAVEGTRTFVTGGMRPDGALACWAAFESSRADPELWFYGNLFVQPPFRKLGLARATLLHAFGEISRRGGRAVACFVDPTNGPSCAFHAALDFADSGYMRVDCGDRPFGSAATDTRAAAARWSEAERKLRESAGRCGPWTARVLAHRIRPQRSLRPWRAAPDRYQTERTGSGAEFLVHTRPGACNVVWLSGAPVVECPRSSGRGRVVAYLPESVVGATAGHPFRILVRTLS